MWTRVEGAFCGACGTQVAVEEQQAPPIQAKQASLAELRMVKRKSMARFTYRTITTTVVQKATTIFIEKKTKPIFIKERIEQHEVQNADILSVTSRSHMDIWNIIFGVIFAFTGIFNWLGSVLAALVFYIGFGKVIALALRGGSIIEIPVSTSNAGGQVMALIQNAINKA